MPEACLFVCHVSEDRPVALEVVEQLERRRVRCWIAPRDVRPGKPFDDEIADAIENSIAMLLIFSERCNEKEYIRREVTVAGESKKVIIPFRIENAQPKHGLRVRLSDLHWIDAFVARDKALDEVLHTVLSATIPGQSSICAEQDQRESKYDRSQPNSWQASLEKMSVFGVTIVLRNSTELHVLETTTKGVFLDGIKVSDVKGAFHQSYFFKINEVLFQFTGTVGLFFIRKLS